MNERDALLPAVQSELLNVETGVAPLDPAETRHLIARAEQLIRDAELLASSPTPPAATICS